MRWHRRDPMAPGALRRECRRILREMPVPDPFTVAGFIKNIEAERGREIRLVELPADVPGQTGACGLWVKHRQRPLDLILHVQGTTKFHRKRSSSMSCAICGARTAPARSGNSSRCSSPACPRK